MEAIINISKRFEVTITDVIGDFITGLSIDYEVRDSVTNSLETSGTLSETVGVYYFDYTFTSLKQYRILYFTPTGFSDEIETVDVIKATENAVWDESLSSHTIVGSTGEALDDADATADPSAVADAVWQYSSTGIGRKLTEGTKDTEIDAIKAKTDNLPVDPTSETTATSNKDEIISEIDDNETKIDNLSTQLTNAVTTIVGQIDANEVKIDTVKVDTDALIAKIESIAGLVHDNSEIVDHAYDSNGNLTSATIKHYANATDLTNQVSVIRQYKLTSTYDLNNLNVSFKLEREI